MLGSLTKYHNMNDPAVTIATAATAIPAAAYRRVRRYANQQPSNP